MRPTPGSDQDPAIVVPPSSSSSGAGSGQVVTGATLAGKMDDLTGLLRELGEVQENQKRSWRWIKGGSGFLLFDVIVSIFGAIFIYIGNGVVDDVRAQGALIQREIHETCSLYGFVINSYNERSRSQSVLGPDKYDNFYRQLEGSADRLQCGIPHKI